MLMIEMRKTEDGTTEFYIWSGEKVPRGFTPETDQDQIAVFHKLLNDNEETIFSFTREYRAAIERNMELLKTKGKGKNWPIFNMMEKLLNKLQKEAGIGDT